MKPIFATILCLLSLYANSQVIVNNPFTKEKELSLFLDSASHTQIITENYLSDSRIDSSRKWQIHVYPAIGVSETFSREDKYFSSDYKLGVSCNINFKQKLNLSLVTFTGLQKPEQFMSILPDTFPVVRGYGRILHTKGDFNIYAGAVGTLTYSATDYLSFEVGNNKTFLGDGYRSLLLSDNASPSPFGRITLDIWKIKYLFMTSRQRGYDERFPQEEINTKFNVTHYLSYNITKRLNLSLFETVIFSPRDSSGRQRMLDLNYFNPVIFLRPVEFSIGSPDNVLIGISGHLKIFKSSMLYGQIFVDEFIMAHIKSSKEYWDEKYGLQAGFKSYNLFNIKNLFSQIELNAIRPYTYSHSNPIESYTHSYEPLAHPFGSNFAEGIAIISYRINNLCLQAKSIGLILGANDSLNYGQNPITSYTSRVSDEDVKWLQGNRTKVAYAEIMAAYQKFGTQLSFSVGYARLTNNLTTKQDIIVQLKLETPIFTQENF